MEARDSPGTPEMFASRSDELQGLWKMQKWKPLTNICKNHYMGTGENLGSGLFGSQPYSSSSCVVSTFILYFCFGLCIDPLLWASVSSHRVSWTNLSSCVVHRSQRLDYKGTNATSVTINYVLFDLTVGRNVWLYSNLFVFLLVYLLADWFIES